MFTATTIEITHTVQITISIEGVTCNTLPHTLVFLYVNLNETFELLEPCYILHCLLVQLSL